LGVLAEPVFQKVADFEQNAEFWQISGRFSMFRMFRLFR